MLITNCTQFILGDIVLSSHGLPFRFFWESIPSWKIPCPISASFNSMPFITLDVLNIFIIPAYHKKKILRIVFSPLSPLYPTPRFRPILNITVRQQHFSPQTLNAAFKALAFHRQHVLCVSSGPAVNWLAFLSLSLSLCHCHVLWFSCHCRVSSASLKG